MGVARADMILAAVQQIHEASLTPGGWTNALPIIGHATGSEFAFLFGANGCADITLGHGTPPDNIALVGAAARSGRLPPWLGSLPPGVARRASDFLSDRDFERSTFYNEVPREFGAYYATATELLGDPRQRVYCVAVRAHGRDDFTSEDVSAMQVLVPHIMTALRVTRRLAAADLRTAAGGAALDQLEAGVILVDARARIVFANQTAEAILAGNDGLGTDRDGLRACSLDATQALRRMVASCDLSALNGEAGGTIEIPRADGYRSLRIVIAPFRVEPLQIDTAWLGAGRPVAILTFAHPERGQRARKEHLRRRFGLTPAEADVALEILKGDGRDASAARLGISATTVRAHLSHIFEKTGVHRQAELVRLLMQSEREWKY